MEEIHLLHLTHAQVVAVPRYSCLAQECKQAGDSNLTYAYNIGMYS